jgi:ribosomal protein S18 acetylase RimI-like enzyme
VRSVRQTIEMIAPGRAREAWVELLELADEPAPLRHYLDDGTLYGVVHDGSGRPRAAVLAVDRSDGTTELRAVAVAEDEQGTGLGSWLVSEVCARLRARGIRRVVVGTATSGVRQLAFYQRLGFRLDRIERDFFTADKGYPPDLSENGIPTRDMAWMDRDLG